MSFLPRLFLRPSLTSLAGPSRIPIPINLSSSFSTSSICSVKQKLKSHSGSKKRFFANANGMAQTGKSHLNTAFSTGRINRLAKSVYVSKTQGRRIKKMLPYA
ncbi:ribosomal protein L35 [Kwoniella bestiolae CBS 10118]|uniref:Ribosomal protein L35 n=1 Tax=Kwoniella bestiolae CBS 10118 TaxID=1296100 RepID=A0AAJ8K5V8_9TREE